MRKRAKGLWSSRLTEDNIVEMSICDRGNALEKDVGKRQVPRADATFPSMYAFFQHFLLIKGCDEAWLSGNGF
jgi:hypothetical protein